MEFEMACSQEPRCVPALAQIHPEDERIKQSPWYWEGMTTPPPEPDNKGKASTKKERTSLKAFRTKTIESERYSIPERKADQSDKAP